MPEDPEFSDIIAELDVTAFGDWNVGMGVQWDPSETRSEKGDVQLQYKPESDRVVNLGYRFRRGRSSRRRLGRLADRRQLERYARMVYSLEDRQVARPVRRLRVRLLLLADPRGRPPLRVRPHGRKRQFLLQLELNGLSSVGVGADAFLERRFGDTPPSPPEP